MALLAGWITYMIDARLLELIRAAHQRLTMMAPGIPDGLAAAVDGRRQELECAGRSRRPPYCMRTKMQLGQLYSGARTL